jgi:hypothetical protein
MAWAPCASVFGVAELLATAHQPPTVVAGGELGGASRAGRSSMMMSIGRERDRPGIMVVDAGRANVVYVLTSPGRAGIFAC